MNRFLKIYMFFVVVFLLEGVGLTSHQQSTGHMATFQLYWWRKTSGTPLYIISGTNRHLSRTTNIP
jgi:hypothetical protein